MFIILIFVSLLDIASSATLKINVLPNWELKQNFLGQDYVLVEGKEGKNSLIIKKIPLTKNEASIEKKLKEMLEAKKIAAAPWKNIKVLEKQNLTWDDKNAGVLLIVEHEKNNLPFLTLLGGYPVGENYYFIFYSETSPEFQKKRNQILKLIQNIKMK
jgi:hypothetical protein